MVKRLTHLICLTLALKVALIWNALTPISNINEIESRLSEFLLFQTHLNYEVKGFSLMDDVNLEETFEYQPAIVIDYSTEVSKIEKHIHLLYPSCMTYLIANSEVSFKTNSKIKHLHPNATIWSDIAKLLSNHFGWNEAIQISSDSEIANSSQNGEIEFKLINLKDGMEQRVYENFVTREIRESGIHPIVVISNKSVNDHLLRAFTKFEMDKDYAIILLGSHCLYTLSLYPTGVLCVTLTGAEAATSEMEVDFWYLLYALNRQPFVSWSVLNCIEGIQHIVGQIEDGVLNLSSIIVFPRGLTSPSWNDPFSLSINLNEWREPSQRFSLTAFEEILLSNSRFKIKPLKHPSCADFSFETGYLNCYIEAKTEKTLVLLSADYRSIPAYQLEFMRRTQLFLPFASSESYIDILSSNENYPNFVRLVQSSIYLSSHLILLNFKLKFSYLTTLRSPVVDDATIQASEDALGKAGMFFLNPKNLTSLIFTNQTYANSLIDFIKNSEQRPILFIAEPADISETIVRLYDAGIRYDDVVLIGTLVSFQEVILRTPAESLTKVLKFRSSWISIDFATYIGELGEYISAKVTEIYGAAYFSDCMSYDLVRHVALALDFAIRRGLNYNDWHDMIFALKSMRFVGCSGPIKFSSEDNNRISIDVDVSQARWIDGHEVDLKVLRTSLAGQSFFTLADYEWYDGSNEVPRQSRLTYKGCPFPEEYRIESLGSQKLTAAINWGFVGALALLSIFSYSRLHFGHPFLENTTAVILSTQDYVVIGTTFVELLFINGIGPSADAVSNLFGGSLTIWKDISMDGDTYLNLLILNYTSICLGLAFTLAVIVHKFRPFNYDFHLAAYFVLQPLSFLFMLTMTSIFNCPYAASEDSEPELSDAYMDIDCSIGCWTGKHRRYVIASSVIFALYLIIPVHFASLLTNNLDGLQFNINPAYLYVSKLVHMSFIALYRTKRLIHSSTYSAVFISLLAMYSIACSRFKVFSIPLLDTVYRLLLILLVIGCTIVVLWKEVYTNLVVWTTIWGILTVVVSLIYYRKMRRLPKLITSPPPVDSAAIFRFAFKLVNLTQRSLYLTERYRPAIQTTNIRTVA